MTNKKTKTSTIDVSDLIEESIQDLSKTKKREEITAEDIGKIACDKFDEAFRIAARADILEIPKNRLTKKEKKSIKLINQIFFN